MVGKCITQRRRLLATSKRCVVHAEGNSCNVCNSWPEDVIQYIVKNPIKYGCMMRRQRRQSKINDTALRGRKSDFFSKRRKKYSVRIDLAVMANILKRCSSASYRVKDSLPESGVEQPAWCNDGGIIP